MKKKTVHLLKIISIGSLALTGRGYSVLANYSRREIDDAIHFLETFEDSKEIDFKIKDLLEINEEYTKNKQIHYESGFEAIFSKKSPTFNSTEPEILDALHFKSSPFRLN